MRWKPRRIQERETIIVNTKRLGSRDLGIFLTRRGPIHSVCKALIGSIIDEHIEMGLDHVIGCKRRLEFENTKYRGWDRIDVSQSTRSIAQTIQAPSAGDIVRDG